MCELYEPQAPGGEIWACCLDHHSLEFSPEYTPPALSA